MPAHFLEELSLVAALAVGVTLLLARLSLPTVTGLLVAGALSGPYGLKLVEDVHTIELMAEVGVVLLLFTIGLEFSLERLKDIFAQVALGAGLQVGLTIAATVAVALGVGLPTGKAVFFGFLVSLSSTAIVLRALADRRELDAPHGRFIVGTLIFQDLCVVPMVLLVPVLSSAEPKAQVAGMLAWALLKAAVMVVVTLVASARLLPRVLSWVDASRSREVFLLAILGLCLGTAYVSQLAGLSLALGAFLGGMLVAGTEYQHRAMGDVLPLRDAFVSIFFVSLGMLFDVRVVLAQPVVVLGLLAGFLLAKGLVATLAAQAMRFPARVAWLAGVGLAQFSEFGFVLSRLGLSTGLVTEGELKPVLAAGVLSMLATPLLIRLAPHVTAGERLLAPLERLLGVRSIDDADEGRRLSGHVVLVGFGLAGRLMARALQRLKVDFVVLELNAANVALGKQEGLPVYYADATSTEALGHAHLPEARMLVLLMNDPTGAQRVVDTARRVAPEVPVMMRSRYLAEAQGLMKLGAQDVVAEEVEGAVEVLARLLRRLELPRNVIDGEVHTLRGETQASARAVVVPRPRLKDLSGLDELKVEMVLVRPGSPAVGQSAVGMKLRSATGALVVGVRRGERLLEHLDPEGAFQENDVVYLAGTLEAVGQALRLFEVST